MNKYRNRKTVIHGITFDSKRESERYSELLLLQKAGEIKELELQPHFLLQEGFVYQGKKERKIEYVADFQYIECSTGKVVVEDVKGMETPVFKQKRKLFLKLYGETCEFRIIK